MILAGEHTLSGFFSSPEDMFADSRERKGEGRAGERSISERSTDWLPPKRALAGDQTYNLFVSKTTLEPTEPRWPGGSREDFEAF